MMETTVIGSWLNTEKIVRATDKVKVSYTAIVKGWPEEKVLYQDYVGKPAYAIANPLQLQMVLYEWPLTSKTCVFRQVVSMPYAISVIPVYIRKMPAGGGLTIYGCMSETLSLGLQLANYQQHAGLEVFGQGYWWPVGANIVMRVQYEPSEKIAKVIKAEAQPAATVMAVGSKVVEMIFADTDHQYRGFRDDPKLPVPVFPNHT